jgi:hypothetical protein
MGLKLTLVMLSAVIMVTALYHATTVYAAPAHAHDHGCSVASLKGTYAFRRTGVNNVLGGPIAQIGIAVLDGDGNILLIRTTRSSNGVIEDWTNEPAPGSYTVNPDCTGTFFDELNNLVVFDGGKRYFLLSTGTGTITTEEATRIEEQD